ncbi:MAG: protein-L-isoaspartate(D-aspartate) O-methyltransferase [Bacillota bacterium]
MAPAALQSEHLDPRVLAAMARVPRHRFVPAAYQAVAYADRALPIGWGQSISQPYIVALMTTLLALKPGDRVLEVGTGSGYQAAVLAALTPYVYSIDVIPELALSAAERLRRLGYSSVQIRVGDGYLGWPEQAPFDAIVVTAAPDHVPPPLLDQLKVGGRLVVPVGPRREGQVLWLVRKLEDRVEMDNILPVLFVPLVRPSP